MNGFRFVLGAALLSILSTGARGQTPDLAEGNAASWGAFASDFASTTLSDDTARVRAGASSLRFVTLSGFDTGVQYPAAAGLNLDASAYSHLVFWEYPENSTPIGWQGNQPIIEIVTGAGTITLTPESQQTPNFAWRLIKAPLAGGGGWTRTSTGTPNLADVDQIRIHHDTWDAGFAVTFDGVQFVNLGEPPAGPPAPFQVDPDAISPRVALFIFDPTDPAEGNQRTHQVYGWQDPELLARQVVKDFLDVSHGKARFNVVEVNWLNEHPRFDDGFQHTPASFAVAWANHDFHEGHQFDYVGFAQQHNLGARVDAGEIDEVWIYAPPIGGMWESCMAGQGAYWINGPAYPAAGGQRVYPIMGLNYERGVAEAIHSFGHRVESTMVHSYGPWAPNRDTTWNRFTLLDSQSPGQGGVGNIHFPVNGASDYDYANLAVVQSNADAWYNYPNLHDATRAMNVTEWSPGGLDTQRDYLKWWYAHLPHAPGRAPDGYLANWWRYILDLEQFKGWDGRVEGTIGVPSVSIVSPPDQSVFFDRFRVVAQAEVDGALGRVDLYIDDVLHSSDSLAPYVFEVDPAGLTAGFHQLRVQAYELQNGTESVGAPVLVRVQKCLADVSGIGGPPEPRDGQLTVDDLIAFVNAFSEGCP